MMAILCYNAAEFQMVRRNWKRTLALVWSIVALITLVAADPPLVNEPVMETDLSAMPRVIAAWLRTPYGGPTPLAVIIAPRITTYSHLSAFSYTVERDGSLIASNPVSDAVLID